MNRRNKGEGSIYKTIEKHKRKIFLKEICSICKECENKCNREHFERCDKCINCKEECLKYCDRYYCYKNVCAQVTINGKQTTVARAKTQKEVTEQKKFVESQVLTKNYVKKNNITILDIIKKVDNEKFKMGEIKPTTQTNNKYKYKKIEKSFINDIPVQKLTYKNIQEFLNLQRYSSQSEINKLVNKLNNGFDRAVLDKIISYPDNPMLRVKTPISFKNVKKVEAFEISEEIKLLKYLAQTDVIVKSQKSNYDNNTIRNLIIIGLFTTLRIGELGAIDYTKHIDFNKKHIIIERTLTKDENENVILGTETKTGKYKKKKGIKDIRYIPFSLFDEDIITYILKEQIKIAKRNKKNTNNLLFCDKSGKFLSHTAINSIFKRICREANIKLELDTGCHFHMTRHTSITRLIEFGMDLMIISSIAGHSSIRQIEETYGHILQKFRNWQIDNPGKYFSKEDLIDNQLKVTLLNIYHYESFI